MNFNGHQGNPHMVKSFDLSDAIHKSRAAGPSPVVSELAENREMIEEMLMERNLSLEKNPQISKLIDFEFVSGLELFLVHHIGGYVSNGEDQCGVCNKKFYTNLTKLNFNDILEDVMTPKENEIIRLGRCTKHYFHVNCILQCISSQTVPSLKCNDCVYVLFPTARVEEEKSNQDKGLKKQGSLKNEVLEGPDVLNISGARYRIVVNEKSDPLLQQILMNKDYLEELLRKKQGQTKDSKITKISDYHFITALELFIRHHDPKHNSLDDEKCSICMCEFIDDTKKLTLINLVEDMSQHKDDEVIRLDKCDGHYFHTGCMLNYISSQAASFIKCPNCSKIYGIMTGTQPPGTMSVTVNNNMRCSGYNDCGTIIIQYHFSSGTLSNGKRYSGTSRTAYLPDNKEGREVLNLLKVSFDRKLTFIVGTSVTTGMTDTVVWNGVHHKTHTSGGSASFGYPDPTYFSRVKQELAARGVL